MEKWQYNWDVIGLGIVEHSELLSKRGKEGWEMITAMAEIGAERKIRIYWKRKILKERSNTP